MQEATPHSSSAHLSLRRPRPSSAPSGSLPLSKSQPSKSCAAPVTRPRVAAQGTTRAALSRLESLLSLLQQQPRWDSCLWRLPQYHTAKPWVPAGMPGYAPFPLPAAPQSLKDFGLKLQQALDIPKPFSILLFCAPTHSDTWHFPSTALPLSPESPFLPFHPQSSEKTPAPPNRKGPRQFRTAAH